MGKISYSGYIVLSIILLIFMFILLMYIIRMENKKEINELNPFIYCESVYISKSDILWVIPLYENKSIADNKEWCNQIKNMNKTLGMLGVYDTYNEFNQDKDLTYLQKGINAFEKCFGYRPLLFKAPQLKISPNNINLIKNNGLEIEGFFSELTHKDYHCSDTQPLPFNNRFNDFY